METNFEKLNIQSLVQKLESQNLLKKDYVIPSNLLRMQNGELSFIDQSDKSLNDLLSGLKIGFSGSQEVHLYKLTDTCHSQVAEKLSIPISYYKYLRINAIDMLDYNVTEWLQRKNTNHLVRTFEANDGGENIARAFLSDRYKMLDNYDILISALEAIRGTGQDVKIESADLTDKRMIVRFTSPSIVQDAPDLLKNYRVPQRADGSSGGSGHGVAAGLVISNSETGHGTFTIAPRVMILACSNGMILNSEKIAERHLGSKLNVGNIEWSQNTRNKEIELIQSQVQDSVRIFLSPNFLGTVIDNIRVQGSQKLQHPVDAIYHIGSSLQLSEEKKKALLDYFMQGADNTGFGAVQALTFLAQEESPESRYQLESESVRILQKIHTYDKPLEKKGVFAL